MRRFFLGLAICGLAGVWPAIASADNKQFSQKVAATLRDSGRLSDYAIGVNTKNGVVELKGRVSSEEQMATALEIAGTIPGVNNVENYLEIQPSPKKAVGKGAAPKRQNNAPRAQEQMEVEAQNTAQEAMSAARGAYPDPSIPAQTQGARKDIASRLRAKKTMVASKQPSLATQESYQVKQASQNVPGSFTPGEGTVVIPAPQPPMQPQMQSRMNMAAPLGAPVAAAAMVAGAMSAPPPNCMPGMGSGVPLGVGPGVPGPGGVPGGPGGPGGPMAMAVPAVSGGVAPARYDQPYMPNYAWPSYAAYPNYGAVTYPRQYSPTAWPYIGPFYPYPQVPLGWRKVMLEWDDGWWMLNFKQ